MAEKSLKSGWRKVKFGDVVRQVKDKVDPEASGLERYVAGDHMSTDDLRIRRWGEIGTAYLGPAFHMRFQPGQVLYGSRRTYLRKVAVADFMGICANTTFVMETRDASGLLPEFLPLVMQTEAFHAHAIKQSKGSVNPYINFTDLVWFEFALPPMDEQRRFAALLRAATRSSEALEEALHAARRVVQAFKDNLLQSHAPKQCQISSLANLLVGSPESGCSAHPQDADTGHFVLGLSALTRNGYRRGDYKPVEKASRMLAAKLCAGDLLISRSNTVDRVGYVGIFDEERDDVSFPDTMMRISADRKIVEPQYLEALLQSTTAREFLMRVSAGTSASMKKINRANLLKLELPVPDINIQRVLLRDLAEVNAAMARIETRYAAARNLVVRLVNQVAGEKES